MIDRDVIAMHALPAVITACVNDRWPREQSYEEYCAEKAYLMAVAMVRESKKQYIKPDKAFDSIKQGLDEALEFSKEGNHAKT